MDARHEAMREPPRDYPEGMPEYAVAVNSDVNGSSWFVRTVVTGLGAVGLALIGWNLAATFWLAGDMREVKVQQDNDHDILCALATQQKIIASGCKND